MSLATIVLQHLDRQGAFTRFYDGSVELLEEDGLKYADCMPLVIREAKDVVERAGPDIIASMAFEFLEIEDLPPHFHQECDSVAIVLSGNPRPGDFDLLLEQPFRRPFWREPLMRGQVIILPRGLVHGFSRREGVEKRGPLWLMTGGLPLKDGDTYFV